MSLMIDQLAYYLAGQGEGTIGVDLFKFRRPSSPVACVSLHATGGYPPERYGQRERPTIMIFARAATPDGALEKAYSLYARLNGQENLDLGAGIWALSIEAVASPAYVGEEQAANATAHLASFNIALDLRTAST